MNKTQNHHLSQWEKSDRVLMEDFNADNAKIDGALKAEADARAAETAALRAAITKFGNCRVETQTYTGTGKCGADNPTRITFPAMPTFFVVFGGGSVAVGLGGDDHIISVTYTSGQSYSFGCSGYSVTWTGNQMTLRTDYMQSQLNSSNALYHVVSFYKMDGR